MVTMRDIAAETGLTVSAVSHILHKGDLRYSAATRQRVQAAAGRLGYRPNLLAQSLALGKTHSFGVVGHDLATPLNVERLQAIAQAARRAGYHLFLSGGESGDPELFAKAVEEFLARKVDGLFLFVMPGFDLRVARRLQERKVPFVLLGRADLPADLPVLSVDTNDGMYHLVRHLLALGHREFAFAAGPVLAAKQGSRMSGLERALGEAGLTLPADRILSNETATIEAVRAFTRAQLQQPRPPTAILYANDEAALVGLHTILQMGLTVPGDVSVAGFDDLPVARCVWPELTTVHQPRTELSELAVELLLAQLPPAAAAPARQVVLSPQLVVRQSTGPVKAS